MVMDITTTMNLTVKEKLMCRYLLASTEYCCNNTSGTPNWTTTLSASSYYPAANCNALGTFPTVLPANEVGDLGDYFAIMVQNGTTHSKAKAIVYGRRVTTKAAASTSQVSELGFASYDFATPAIVNYADITTTGNPA